MTWTPADMRPPPPPAAAVSPRPDHAPHLADPADWLLNLALAMRIARWAHRVAVAETSYLAGSGNRALSPHALVFPFVMLTQMMSAGAMGGGVSSAIIRGSALISRPRGADLALSCRDDRRLPCRTQKKKKVFKPVTMLMFRPAGF